MNNVRQFAIESIKPRERNSNDRRNVDGFIEKIIFMYFCHNIKSTSNFCDLGKVKN